MVILSNTSRGGNAMHSAAFMKRASRDGTECRQWSVVAIPKKSCFFFQFSGSILRR